jgi:hypothetical protein
MRTGPGGTTMHCIVPCAAAPSLSRTRAFSVWLMAQSALAMWLVFSRAVKCHFRFAVTRPHRNKQSLYQADMNSLVNGKSRRSR